MQGFDSSNSIPLDSTAAGHTVKKPTTGQSAIKFQQVLASTRKNSHKDSNEKSDNANSKHEKNNDVKDNTHKPQTVKLKSDTRALNTSNEQTKQSTKESDIKENSNVGEEIELNNIENFNDVNELISLAPASELNIDKPTTITENFLANENIETVDSSIEQANEINIIAAQDTVQALPNDIKNISNTANTNENSTETQVVIAQASEDKVTQTVPMTAKGLKGENLPSEESLEIDSSQIKISASDELVEDQASFDEENISNFAVPINSGNAQISTQEQDISRDMRDFDLQKNLVKSQPTESPIEITSKIASDEAMSEGNAVIFNGGQNTLASDRAGRDNTISKETQNILNPFKSDDLLPLKQEAFDQEGSEFDNLFSKMDSFITTTDGKLSIDFKEIASLPEENIPHRADQISMAVKSAVGRGQSEISLRMYPEDLGAVDVKIEFSEVGKIQSIKFFATKESTLELLQKDYSILERSLKEVVNAEDASLSFNLRDGKGEGSEYQPQENFGLNNFGENSDKVVTANYLATLQIQEDDQVDITV